MVTLLLLTVCAAQPGVAIGVGQRGSELRVSRTGPASVGLLGQLDADNLVLTDVISPSSTCLSSRL